MNRIILCALLIILNIGSFAEAEEQAMIDLSNAVLLFGPDATWFENRGTIPLLRDECARRGLEWPMTHGWNDPKFKSRPVIAVGLERDKGAWMGPFLAEFQRDIPPDGPEDYRIVTDPAIPAVIIVGATERGARAGVGRLIREIRFDRGKTLLPARFRESSGPRLALRGHQLGYRPKTNSYDAWDKSQWRQYIHELVVFGANAIELVPPHTDDDRDSPHFPLPPAEMLKEMSQICKNLDLNVWLWFPVMDPVDTNPAKTEPLLKEWDEVFQNMPRLDAVFVPGGDPGHIPPKPLFAFLEKAAEVLHKSHPKATIWISPQGFDSAKVEEFLELVKAEPIWLAGVVFGPQVRLSLSELRKALPAKLPIRGYPDITHSRQCQHPVPDWDLAFACTEGREAINPRPFAEAALCRAYQKDTVGFISYSEGCNDDVNKAVWSALAWNADADVVDVLRQYGRYFLGEKYTEPFAQALLGLERNWSGPLATNAGVETTLRQLQDLERVPDPFLKRNWRFQQALYRGYYDAYLRDRLIQESALQQRAHEFLRDARRTGADRAMTRASTELAKAVTEPVSLDRRARVFELGEALFQSVHMQLSAPKYQAIDPERGANMDTIDTPLNDRMWFDSEFSKIRRLESETGKLRALEKLLTRDDPGPGGFYDALGDPNQSPHLVREPSVTADPLFERAPFHGFALRAEWPMAWRRYAQAFYDAPLRLRYENLDKTARYRVRVVYAGDNLGAKMRLQADDAEVHPWLAKPNPVAPLEFPIPAAATADGRLTLTWNAEPGCGGNGRACQVAEVWLVRDEHK